MRSKKRNRCLPDGGRASRQSGFTLVETLIAVIILVVGLVSVSHLMMVAINSNNIANRSTVATSLASQRMEELMAVPYTALADNTNALIDADPGDVPGSTGANYRVEEVSEPGATAGKGVSGVYVTSWQITTVSGLKCIRVRTQARGPFAGMTRAELTTFRADNAPAVAAPTATPSP